MFTRTALISGAVWLVWHFPLVVLANYHNEGAPLWFGLVCFAVMELSAGFIFAWLRLKSSSIWPAVLVHASHNLFIQNVFTPLTLTNSLTPYLMDEFGIMLALVSAAVAYFIWRKRSEVESTQVMPQKVGAN